MKARKHRSIPLNFETLEQRDTPSVTGVVHNNYLISINCNSTPSNVSVETTDIEYGDGSPGSQDLYFVTVKDTTNGFNHQYTVKNSSATKIVFNGGSGNDTFKSTSNFKCTIYGNGGNDTITGGPLGDIIYGGTGNDTLNGSGGNDQLFGDSGNDTLSGGSGNDVLKGSIGDDKLYGDGGNDYLYGQDGADQLFGGDGNDTIYGGTGKDVLKGEGNNDFLDDGSGLAINNETNDGGTGTDFFAYRPVNVKAVGSDVNQGSQNTCWILSPLASAANSGMDLKSRITYNGSGDYTVKLYKPGTPLPLFVHVNLEGGAYSFEPTNGSDQAWVILFERAILKQFNVDITNPASYPSFATSPSQSLPYITGRPASLDLAGGTYLGSFGLSDLQKIKTALSAGKLVCAGSRQVDYGNVLPGVVSVSSPYICGSHVYSVVSVDMVTKHITLRNPWGVDVTKDADKKILHNMAVQGDNDGIIVLNFDEFIGSFAMMSIS